jgi:hypothetical protein
MFFQNVTNRQKIVENRLNREEGNVLSLLYKLITTLSVTLIAKYVSNANIGLNMAH